MTMDELNRRRNYVIRRNDNVVRRPAAGEKKAAAKENAGKCFHVRPYTDVFGPRNCLSELVYVRFEAPTSAVKRTIS